MTPAEIAAGCQTCTVTPTDDGRWHAQCDDCDIGATGDTPEEARYMLQQVAVVEMRLAVEQEAQDGGTA